MSAIKEIISALISWPMAVIVTVIVLRHPLTKLIHRLIHSDTGKAKFGPIEIELGQMAERGKQVVSDLNRLSTLMAETRLLELEITDSNFGPRFSRDQQERMKKQIEELKQLTQRTSAEET